MKASNWEIMANPPLNDKRYVEIVTTRPSLRPFSQSFKTRPSGALPSESLQIVSHAPRRSTGQIHAVGLAARLWSRTWVQVKHSRR